jgi:hypothetical protein
MKSIGTLLLVALIFFSNGCMTYSSVQRARGTGGEWVEMNSSDRIIRRDPKDGTQCVIQRISQKGETNEMRLHLVTGDASAGYVCKPGYYALLPLTVPADIATSPFQLMFFLIWQGTGGG